MKRFFTAGFLAAVILFPLFAYTYKKGVEDGVTRYKLSENFALTLDSQYRFGFLDGKDDRENCLNVFGQFTASDGQCWQSIEWEPCRGDK